MTEGAQIINFEEIKKEKQNKSKKNTHVTPMICNKDLVDNEVARLRAQFGLDKKEEKK